MLNPHQNYFLIKHLSIPVKESGMILLQTIPDTIDIDIFEQSLLKTFPDVVSVHDLHIWRLSGQQYVATAHIIFEDPKVGLHPSSLQPAITF